MKQLLVLVTLVSVTTAATLVHRSLTSENNADFETTITVPLSTETADSKVETTDSAKLPLTLLKINPTRSILLQGPIHDTSAVVEHIKRLLRDSNEPVNILLDSPGGSVVDGSQVVDLIRGSKAHVNTICIKLCASMAAIIHQEGHTRMMLPHSLLMFHNAAGGFQGPFNIVKSRFQTFNSYVNKYNVRIAKRAGISYSDFMLRVHSEIWLDGEDATLQKFNDKLVTLVVDKNEIPAPSMMDGIFLSIGNKNDIMYILDRNAPLSVTIGGNNGK